MSHIELVPLIELPGAVVNRQAPWWSLPDRPEDDIERVMAVLKAFEGQPIIEVEPYFVRLTSLSDRQLLSLIKCHVADTPVTQSCALFGGYGVLKDNVWMLLPQCCSTLADIKSWLEIADFIDTGGRGKIKETGLMEGHPSPRIRCEGHDVTFQCDDPFEGFYPFPPETVFKLNRFALLKAVRKVAALMAEQYSRLNGLAPEFGVETLSHLFWEE